jgi:hypothetical protein
MKLHKFKIKDHRFFDFDYGHGDATGAGGSWGDGYGDHDNDEFKTKIKDHVVDMYQLSFGEVIDDSI